VILLFFFNSIVSSNIYIKGFIFLDRIFLVCKKQCSTQVYMGQTTKFWVTGSKKAVSTTFDFLMSYVISYKIVFSFIASEPQTSHKHLQLAKDCCTWRGMFSFLWIKMLSMKTSQTVLLSPHILHNFLLKLLSKLLSLKQTSPRLDVLILKLVLINLKSRVFGN
jgi:hypothetical protein